MYLCPAILRSSLIMESLEQFSIPLKSLNNEIYQFDYQVDRTFFSEFQDSPIKNGKFDVALVFDKRPDMIVMDFDFKGTMQTECDRCLEGINLPVEGVQQILVKYAEEKNDEDEVVYITTEDTSFNIAKYIFECICLAIHLIKVYDCEEDENRACNDEMLSFLDNSATTEEEEGDKDDDNGSVWDALKDFGSN